MSHNTESSNEFSALNAKPAIPGKKNFWAHFLPGPKNANAEKGLQEQPASEPILDMPHGTQGLTEQTNQSVPIEDVYKPLSDSSSLDFVPKVVHPFDISSFHFNEPIIFPDTHAKQHTAINFPDIQPFPILNPTDFPINIHSKTPSSFPGHSAETGGKPFEASFDQHQREYLAKHADEPKPTDTGPFAVAIVSRAYRELSNGNLTERLLSLVSQKIPTSEFKAYIAVNNLRTHALAADVWERDKETLEGLPDEECTRRMRDLIRREFDARGIEYTDNDSNSMYNSIGLKKRAADFRENQATLRILGSLTQAVNTLSSSGNNDKIVATALEQISNAAMGFVSEGQLALLLDAARLIIKKGIAVMGVDCSSLEKAYEEIKHGRATNEACHIAISQGAKYIDISDMDEYHGPEALKEILALSKTDDVDVLIRPLKVVAPLHPEQFQHGSRMWASLVQYYANTLTGYHDTYSNYTTHSSGTQIVSAKTFRRHEYPELGHNEDFEFAKIARGDTNLKIRYAIASDLKLANRGRDASWDGSHMNESSTAFAENVRASQETKQRDSISQLCLSNEFTETKYRTFDFRELPDVPNILELYRRKRKEFFDQNQQERVRWRRVFLGITPEGKVDQQAALPTLYRMLQQHNDWDADQIMKQAQLDKRHAAFFEQNPLIVKAVLQEIRRIQTTSASATKTPHEVSAEAIPLEHLPAIFSSAAESTPHLLSLVSITQHIVNSLPELFGEPLKEEPMYIQDKVIDIPVDQINVTNWIHISQAEKWMKAYLANYIADHKDLPIDTRIALETLDHFHFS